MSKHSPTPAELKFYQLGHEYLGTDPTVIAGKPLATYDSPPNSSESIVSGLSFSGNSQGGNPAARSTYHDSGSITWDDPLLRLIVKFLAVCGVSLIIMVLVGFVLGEIPNPVRPELTLAEKDYIKRKAAYERAKASQVSSKPSMTWEEQQRFDAITRRVAYERAKTGQP